MKELKQSHRGEQSVDYLKQFEKSRGNASILTKVSRNLNEARRKSYDRKSH